MLLCNSVCACGELSVSVCRKPSTFGRVCRICAPVQLNDLIGDKPLFMPLNKYFHKYGGVYKLSFATVPQVHLAPPLLLSSLPLPPLGYAGGGG